MVAARKNSPGSSLYTGRTLGSGWKYVKHNSLIDLAFQKVKNSSLSNTDTKDEATTGGSRIMGVRTEEDSFNKYLLSTKHVPYTVGTFKCGSLDQAHPLTWELLRNANSNVYPDLNPRPDTIPTSDFEKPRKSLC